MAKFIYVDNPYPAPLLPSAVFDLDASQTQSYTGGQTWHNIQQNPADGSTQTFYDWLLGLTGSSEPLHDPTLVFGPPPAFNYASGTAQCHSLPPLTGSTFFNNLLGNASGAGFPPCTIALAFTAGPSATVPVSGNYAALIGLPFGDSFNKASTWRLKELNSGGIKSLHFNHNYENVINDEITLIANLIPSSTHLVFVGLQQSGVKIADNARVFTNTGFGFTGVTAPFFAGGLCIGGITNGYANASQAMGEKIRAISLFNKILSNAEISLVVDQYNFRHGVTYA